MPPGGDRYRAIYDCDVEVDYCWSVPPGDGYAELASCEEEICWFTFGEGDYGYTYRVSCEEQFCEYTAPDGATSVRDSCEYPVCWSSPPGGEFWAQVWGCGEYADEYGGLCWQTPPGDLGSPQLGSCDYTMRFAVEPPEGAILFGLGYDYVYFDGPAC